METRRETGFGRGYSIWLVPRQDPLENILQGKMVEISSRCSTPAFRRHATLVGTLLDSGREVLVKTDTLAKKISPFSITLGEIDYSEEYFKALFIDVQRTPELMNANAVAREVFQEKRLDDEYKPHMSLLYANMPAHEKEVLIREVFREVGGRKAFSGAQFVVDRLDLYSTDGTVDNWYFVDSCYLEKAQNRLQA